MNGKTPTALIIGMTGGVGGAAARALLARGFRVRALTRRDRLGMDRVEWVPGDAMIAADVRRAAEGCDVIVHGANTRAYRNWRGLAIPMLANTIAAATETRATIVFPGTVYNFGPDALPLLSEHSPQHPLTRKGAIRVEMEEMLRDASTRGARVIVVRAGDYFGPGARSSWFSQGMVRAGRPLSRVLNPGAADVGHAWAYLPDVGEAIARLIVRREEFAAFECFHFEGHWLPRGGAMAETICDVAGLPRPRIKAFPWWAVRIASPFVETFREMLEMRYLWQCEVKLDGRKLAAVLGTEPHTDLRDAVRETLESLGCLPRSGVTAAAC